MLEKLWDDVVAGPQPEHGLGRLRNATNREGGGEGRLTVSVPETPTMLSTPATPRTPTSGRKSDNVWRSVFNPGSNSATKTIGAEMFDKPLPNSPTVYDWLYSDETRSKHHR